MQRKTISTIVCAISALSACSGEQPDGAATDFGQIQRTGDPEKGRLLFADKGCVICHSINGVGGKAAPPLDAQTENDVADPIGFATRMWRGAPAMIELQGLELGYSIWLEPQEMVDLATFAANATEQKKLKLDDLDKGLASSFLNERFWEVEDWSEFLENGQEGAGDPQPDDESE